MSAVLTTCLALLKSGDHIVAAHDLFGSSVSLFSNVLSKLDIDTTFVSVADHEAWKSAIKANTRFLFVESPTNPARRRGRHSAGSPISPIDNECLLVVDNCLCTPALQLPFEMGADVVIHSATKFIDGQGRCVGGAVLMQEQALRDEVFSFLRTCGPTMSPFNAWVFLNGLETLSLRMHAHCKGALELARRLEKHPAVAQSLLPGAREPPPARARQAPAEGLRLHRRLRGPRWARGRLVGHRRDAIPVDHGQPRGREDDHHPSWLLRPIAASPRSSGISPASASR